MNGAAPAPSLEQQKIEIKDPENYNLKDDYLEKDNLENISGKGADKDYRYLADNNIQRTTTRQQRP
ncbi:MAG: hypothetical protein FJ333_01120 [Sphingomonadales bacterium]|nr:hypothetical protein [Sphingomonadales bacterium]